MKALVVSALSEDLAGTGLTRFRTRVAVTHALPGVDENLQDHLDVLMSWRSRALDSAYAVARGIRQLGIGLRCLLGGIGPGLQQFLESGAFIPSRPGLSRPDIQVHGVLAVMRDHGKVQATEDGFSLHLRQPRPESRGASGCIRLIRSPTWRSRRTISPRPKTGGCCAKRCASGGA